MSLRITGKHMNVAMALNSRIETWISDVLEKYSRAASGAVTLEKSVRGVEVTAPSTDWHGAGGDRQWP